MLGRCYPKVEAMNQNINSIFFFQWIRHGINNNKKACDYISFLNDGFEAGPMS